MDIDFTVKRLIFFRIEVEEEIRKQVDELMRQELKNLKMVCTDRGVMHLVYTAYTTLLLPSMDSKVTYSEKSKLFTCTWKRFRFLDLKVIAFLTFILDGLNVLNNKNVY